MTLQEFEHAGWLAQVRVPWLPETLWFVSSEKEAVALVGKGISRGRIWTARELAFIWQDSSLTPKRAQNLARVKAELGADILSVEFPAEAQRGIQSGTPGSPGRCFACQGTMFWRSIHGTLICVVCHPPADSKLMAAWIKEGAEQDRANTSTGESRNE